MSLLEVKVYILDGMNLVVESHFSEYSQPTFVLYYTKKSVKEVSRGVRHCTGIKEIRNFNHVLNTLSDSNIPLAERVYKDSLYVSSNDSLDTVEGFLNASDSFNRIQVSKLLDALYTLTHTTFTVY